MIAARRADHGNGREAVDDPVPGARTVEALQQFLKHEFGRVDGAPDECLPEAPHLGTLRRRIPSERQRPDTGIHEQVHRRERSSL